MKQCKNPTCTVDAKTTYCSKRCERAMRNSGQPGYVQLPDIWVSRDTERALYQWARTRDMSVPDLVRSLIER